MDENTRSDEAAEKRSVDLAMLQEYQRALEQALQHYGRFMQAVVLASAGIDPADESKIQQYVDAIRIGGTLTEEHILACNELLQESRAASGFGTVTIGQFQAADAGSLVIDVLCTARSYWSFAKQAASEKPVQMPSCVGSIALDLMNRVLLPKLPLANEIYAELQRDLALARSELKRQHREDEYRTTVTVQNHISIDPPDVYVAPNVTVNVVQPLDIDWETASSSGIRPAPDRRHRFPTPKGARWTELRIRFRDPHRVSIQIRDVHRVVTYEEMGMKDGRSGKPNLQWDLLKRFSDSDGFINWKSSGASRHLKKRVQHLSDALTEYFGISDRPIEHDAGAKGYRTKFVVEPDEIAPAR